MKTLILVRHGAYDERGLTPNGVTSMKALRVVLEKYLGPTAAFYSSDAARTIQSAAILADGTGCDVCQQEFLYSSQDTKLDCESMMQLIEASAADVFVAVTHYEWVNYFPAKLFARQGWGEMSQLFHVDKAEALVIDFETRAVTYVRPLQL